METVSLLKVDSYQDNLQAKLIELLKPLGGIEGFCKPGEKVLIKPNFVLARSVESAATTHPALITALIVLLTDYGCEVAVGDSPGLGSAINVIHKLGLSETFQKYHVKVVELETPAAVDLQQEFPFERRFLNLQLAAELKQFDKIINIPKLKSHGQMGLTLAIKNLFGCVPGPAKGQWHFAAGRDLRAFARLLVEIAYTVKPTLHIIDGIIGMDGNGPTNGRARELNILAAGANPLALDRIIAEMIHQQPVERFPIFEVAGELDLPGLNLEEITVLGESLASFQIKDFQIPSMVQLDLVVNHTFSRLIEWLIRQNLVLDKKKCIHCKECEEHCPAKAIYYQNGIKINEQKCIKCCCCQELCPVGALKVSDPFLIKCFRLVKFDKKRTLSRKKA